MSLELVTREAVLAAMLAHIGPDKGVHVRDLAREVAGVFACPATERQLRAVVVELRRQGHHICGEPATGYFMASCPADLERTCEFLYDRAMTSLAQIAAMQRVSMPDLRGQLRLPT